MNELAWALTLAAPLYNVLFIIIAAVLFFVLITTAKTEIYLRPWKFLALAVCIFVFETLFTILRARGVVNVPVHVNGFFELAIVAVAIYVLLLQTEYVQKSVH